MNQNSLISGIALTNRATTLPLQGHAQFDEQAHKSCVLTDGMKMFDLSLEQQEHDLEKVDVLMAAENDPIQSSIIRTNDFQEQTEKDQSLSSNQSSLLALGSLSEGKSSVQSSKQLETPSTEARHEEKFSPKGLYMQAGGKPHSFENQNIQADQEKSETLFEQEFPSLNDERILNQDENANFRTKFLQNSEDIPNSSKQISVSSGQGEFSAGGERSRRSCRDKTIKYALTHKGAIPKLREQKSEQSKTHQSRNGSLSLSQKEMINNNQNSEEPNEETAQEQQSTHKSSKRSHQRTNKECTEVFKNMFAFDWNLKDIANLKHSPQSELTPAVFWYYVNCLYFPFDAVQTFQSPFDQFISPVLQNIITSSSPSQNSSQQRRNNLNPAFIMDSQEVLNQREEIIGIQGIKSLFKEKVIKRFRKKFKELQERALHESFKKAEMPSIDGENHGNEALVNCSQDEEHDINDLQKKKLQIMISLLEKDIAQLQEKNVLNIEKEFLRVRELFEKTLESESQIDEFPYSGDNMFDQGVSFLSYIDPNYVKDIQNNFDWYLENSNEILLNVGYPSKQEKEFLKHIEQVQQKKNDLKYRKILKQLEQGKKGDASLLDDIRYQNMSTHKRALVTQEDAQCSICNSGDYEDEDLIVFCGNCNIPVHQSCYGIDQLPEGDWLCYTCEFFGFKRGLMIQCMFCPKKGGALKPTNIFSSHEHFTKFNSSSVKGSNYKKSSSSKKLKNSESMFEKTGEFIGKHDFAMREDKSLSLAVILKREFDYQSDIRALNGSNTDSIELLFEKSEKENQIPEDYNFFLQKNEARLESQYQSSAQTPTLYQWIHISCASWIPGPIVTPKTPVRLNKIDEKRFNLQCIICLKKDGACMQCQASRCSISFHVECARRANYCMEIERRERDKQHKLFCEKHRPLKIVKEMEERDKMTIDEIQKYCKVIEKCMDVDQRARIKLQKAGKEENKQPNDFNNKNVVKVKPSIETNKQKKWKEKDKKTLFERVKEKYLLFRKMRINLIRVDPERKYKKCSQRKRSKKRQQKKNSHHTGGCREGLRSSLASDSFSKQDLRIELDLNMLNEEQPIENLAQNNIDNQQFRQASQNEGLVDGQVEQQQQMSQGGDFKIKLDLDFDKNVYYKFNTPMYQSEVDWTITLSRNDFPWNEIKFNNFSARDCFEKYSSMVQDSNTFLKKVLGSKEKYKKMMINQIQLQQQPQQILIPLIGGGTYDCRAYCKCQGAVISDFFVQCDGDQECPYGGWLHPECTEDLKNKQRQELDQMSSWYCAECISRIKEEEDEDKDVGDNIKDFDMQIENEENFEEEDDEEEEDYDEEDVVMFDNNHESEVKASNVITSEKIVLPMKNQSNINTLQLNGNAAVEEETKKVICNGINSQESHQSLGLNEDSSRQVLMNTESNQSSQKIIIRGCINNLGFGFISQESNTSNDS